MNVWLGLFFIALGMGISEVYNAIMWRRYKEGMKHGVSMREWKENKSAHTSIYTHSKAGK